ncbi:MAG: carbonic anhydrase family protein, partial [Pseudomonadales bacterium]
SPAHWSYSGDSGPSHWGDLSEEYAACGIGKNQSPIDVELKDIVNAGLAPIEIHYKGQITSILNNGHTLQANVEKGSYMVAEEQEFKLLQFHMHSPSEHRVGGETFPLEIHFVHQNSRGEIAVVGALFRTGDSHENLRKIFSGAPLEGETIPSTLALTEIIKLKSIPSYFRYNGSLTTPPCTEGLRWYIFPTVLTVSKEQIAQFISVIGYDARGTQPLNARFILSAD